MNQPAVVFVCSKCDAQYAKWTGRCLECGAWGTVGEKIRTKESNKKTNELTSPAATTVKLSDIAGKTSARSATGISELDRVLGGGLVPGSLILLGGEPGIGNSFNKQWRAPRFGRPSRHFLIASRDCARV